MKRRIGNLIIQLNPSKKDIRKKFKTVSILVLGIFVLSLSFSFDRIDRARADSGTVTSSVTVGNAAPTVSGTTLKMSTNSTPIVLTENTTTAVVVVGTGTDTNGGGDISSATATVYLTGVAGNEACSASDVNCYTIASSKCTLGSVSGNDRAVTCTTGLWFLATRTDDDTASWTGFLSMTDGEDYGTGTDTEEVNTLQALTATASLGYGTLSAAATTATSSAVTMQVTTTGNEAVDITVQATNDMCDNAACSSSTLRACQQQYTTSTLVKYEDSGDSYSQEIELSSSTARNLNLASVTPTTHVGNTSDEADDVYWKIGIPSGQAATTYNGTTTITSKTNSNTTADTNETLCN
ncbi:MAG: hypothetical protein A3B96_02350 [Candidatus Spechtbacteria bacterium RIFCSPHIGHO2_02_FULL_43_15b]|uniref:Uncharacterized protein n=1 Tax=Candidatus Spechtbacteria bacterium RIFCSPHIGHO2_01_FULL_43_30 TaxID=1802158 RepID=A0A1G2H528_9BACT|nr:MAG: hypothetical protein A2827_01125 [Candidatus Spechtbacteria bacterium RIFCSPHIGHO2_01_FULL_43_30]OGZ59670.1 MAG: hypothetical protein A3B96_02350 [Candidatus Spechtbacteria bacterium RIFCSPHIGHO2_02_FULL_43_15b]